MLATGDRVPDILLPDPSGVVRSFYDRTRGNPIVIAAIAGLGEARGRAALAALERAFAHRGSAVDCFVVTPDPPDIVSRAIDGLGLDATVLCADDGRAAEALALERGATIESLAIFVLDPNQRVLATFEGDNGAEGAAALLDGLDPNVEGAGPDDTAPVLVIPRVIDAEFCDRLIEAFHERGHESSGIYSLIEGDPVHAVDRTVKRRLDHYVRDDDLIEALKRQVGGRLLPEIDKAFSYRVTRIEEFKITCYRSTDRGQFKPHRDNYSPQTVHRRFAMSLNLNDGYEGGALRFPEYGTREYRPRRGEAIVFSCSLLHEALEVERGDRYVLIGFMYGEDGVRQKQAMQARLGQ